MAQRDSNVASVAVPDPTQQTTGAPITLTATYNNGGVDLAWTSSEVTASTVRVYRRVQGQDDTQYVELTYFNGWEGDFRDEGNAYYPLVAGTVYEYQIRAFD
jgi:hypothetical protein